MARALELIFKGLNLGEGCIWDSFRNKVHFLDINKHKIYSYSLLDKSINYTQMNDYVGCITLDEKNNLMACVKDSFFRLDLEKATSEQLFAINQDDKLRFNDGKCDKFGNLWVGTMLINHSENQGKGSLYCIKNDKVVAEYKNFNIPNGMAWEADKFYHIDTVEQKVFAYDVEDECVLKNKSVAVEIDKSQGSPDGMCMDANGNFWIALWGGSKVVCYSKEQGKIIDEIIIPEKNVSCCAFGGEKLDKLFITSASEDLTGALYCVDMAEVKGFNGNKYKT